MTNRLIIGSIPESKSAYANGLADITLRSATLAKLRSIIRILWLVLAFTQWGMVEHSQNGKAFLKTPGWNRRLR